MPRIAKRDKKLDTATARAKLPARGKPYYTRIGPGIHLGYRRLPGGFGTWSVKVVGMGREWVKRIAHADDQEKAAPPDIMTFDQAVDEGRKLARGTSGETVADDGPPISVAQALELYKAHLVRQGRDPKNATRPLGHLGPLANRTVALLTSRELLAWVDALMAKEKTLTGRARRNVVVKLAPASINRILTPVLAALNLAAETDRRITNAREFKVGLAALPSAQRARDLYVDDDTVRRFVAAAYQENQKLGVLVDTLAVTGTRPSQAQRLIVDDLLDADTDAPVLNMPMSGKGGKNSIRLKGSRFPIEITLELAAMLRQEASGRAKDAPLLTQHDGTAWSDDSSQDYRRAVRRVAASIGLDPDIYTMYTLRHSSIVRALKANVPIRIVAAKHSTSVGQIERNYTRFIANHTDVRHALLRTGQIIPFPPPRRARG